MPEKPSAYVIKKKKRTDLTCPFALEEGHEHKNLMLSQQIVHEKNWPIIIVTRNELILPWRKYTMVGYPCPKWAFFSNFLKA